MSADVPIPHPYRPRNPAQPHQGAEPFCADCFALPTDPAFVAHHSEPHAYLPDYSGATGDACYYCLRGPDEHDAYLPAGATVDDDPEAFASELVAEYAAAVERDRDRAQEARAGARDLLHSPMYRPSWALHLAGYEIAKIDDRRYILTPGEEREHGYAGLDAVLGEMPTARPRRDPRVRHPPRRPRPYRPAPPLRVRARTPMNRHARPIAEYQRAERIRHALDALMLVAMAAVILALVLVYGPDRYP